MANIEDEEEEEIVVVEVKPPKRKNIATLKVRGHQQLYHFTDIDINNELKHFLSPPTAKT